MARSASSISGRPFWSAATIFSRRAPEPTWLYGDGIVLGAGSSATLTGGDDILLGGAGNDVLYGDGTARGAEAATTTITGGADRLVGGAGNDLLWGDGAGAGEGVDNLVLAGGADVFVFGLRDGHDTIMDFRSGEGDRIEVTATPVGWSDLDSNGNGALDDADAWVAIDGADTHIDLGAAAGIHGAAGTAITVVNVVGLVESDFLFV